MKQLKERFIITDNLNKILFSFPKFLKIIPKSVRTRTNKGSLILKLFLKLTDLFISYIYTYKFLKA